MGLFTKQEKKIPLAHYETLSAAFDNVTYENEQLKLRINALEKNTAVTLESKNSVRYEFFELADEIESSFSKLKMYCNLADNPLKCAEWLYKSILCSAYFTAGASDSAVKFKLEAKLSIEDFTREKNEKKILNVVALLHIIKPEVNDDYFLNFKSAFYGILASDIEEVEINIIDDIIEEYLFSLRPDSNLCDFAEIYSRRAFGDIDISASVFISSLPLATWLMSISAAKCAIVIFHKLRAISFNAEQPTLTDSLRSVLDETAQNMHTVLRKNDASKPVNLSTKGMPE